MQKDLVVILNGAGTTGGELRGLYNYLKKNKNYFVYYPGIMPGAFVGSHFPKAKTRDFIKFIDSTQEIVNQKGFRKVYLIGYSLGASTAAILAARNHRIDKVVLIAPIVKNPNYRKFLKGLSSSLAHSKKLTRVQEIFYKEFIRRFMLIPKIHVWHLQLYLHYTKRYLKMINAPTLVVETTKDELVKKKSIDQIEKGMGDIPFRRYKVDSSHFLFFDRNVRNDVIHTIDAYLKEETT
ncbi:MAG: alpha/beta hydrolase [Candidatus Izimaplasma sp.]|nr:alpha/beta hydrolase [Candidatus Izimaplasma bacterium]